MLITTFDLFRIVFMANVLKSKIIRSLSMTVNNVMIKTTTLAYFSGTGCTETVVNCFESQLIKQGINVNKINIATYNFYDTISSDLLIIFSPVYAFRLASIVEDWVKSLPKANKTYATIISVSGGGEISPNTACRVRCKSLLAKKNYNLIYEKMLIMPSNFALQAKEQLNLNLITVLPKKVNKIITDILSLEINITEPKLQDRFFRLLGNAEHLGSRLFGVSIHSSKACNQCGLCIRNCPKRNIQIKNGVPKFGFNCLWCMKCIYACPRMALSPRIMKFTVLKNGFDIKKMYEISIRNDNDMEYITTHNILWQGVIDYLNQDYVK